MIEQLPNDGSGLAAKVRELVSKFNGMEAYVLGRREYVNGSPIVEPNTTGEVAYVTPAALSHPMREYIGQPVLFEDDDIHGQPGVLADITDDGFIDGDGHVWQVCRPAPAEGLIADTDPRYGAQAAVIARLRNWRIVETQLRVVDEIDYCLEPLEKTE